MQRIDLGCEKTPHFIGSWQIDNRELCEEIIEFFERNSTRHKKGSTYYGVDPSKKSSTDLIIYPNDLREPSHDIFRVYLQNLQNCYLDYLQQWPFLTDSLREVDIGPFNIQKYKAGDHFASVHTERSAPPTMHRALAWMTYLNDVEEGGHTHFTHYELDVKPERGKTLIWPSDWTHAHRGNRVTAGPKYIITGWMIYPILRMTAEIEAIELW